MTIDEKLMNDEQFRKKCWDRISSDREFEKEFLILEMRRTIDPQIYAEMKQAFGSEPTENYRWYFTKNLELGKSPGKSPYECCLDKDYEHLRALFGAMEYGTYL